MANAWDRQEGETDKAWNAFLAYRDLPPAIRSVPAAYRQKAGKEKAKQAAGFWNGWAAKYSWKHRATAYDDDQQRIADDARKAEIERIMATRYANMHERVQALDKMAGYLISATKNKKRVWLTETRTFGNGDNAQETTIEKFNADLFTQARAALADIAAEKGERIKKTDLTTGGQPLTTFIGVDPEKV